MDLSKKLFYKRLAKEIIVTIIMALLAIAVIRIRGIEDNAEAVAWELLFFALLAVHIMEYTDK